MHARSHNLMAKHLSRIDLSGKNVLDVGSYDVNGTFRELVESRLGLYTGLDVQPGPNVDVVSHNPYRYPFNDSAFDVVICGNMLHNVPRPWLLIKEFTRILRPGGLAVVVTIYSWGINSYPKDYFRMTDAGLQVLFDDAWMLSEYELEHDEWGNTAGSAIRI